MNKYPVPDNIARQIENNFVYHAPKEDQQERYVFIRNEAKTLALTLATNVKPSRELALALTALEEVMFWANAGIARNE